MAWKSWFCDRLRLLTGLCLLMTAGCSSGSAPPQVLVLGTTTTVQDSGLLTVLMDEFRKESGIEVKTVIGGSGEVLELGRRGDADILLTHSPDAEAQFVDEGWATARRPLMHSDYVLAGPADDPAGCREAMSAPEALRRIADRGQVFVSRGDQSGTHARELKLRKTAELATTGENIVSTGAGMGETLRVASEKKAYVLCDRPTFLTLKATLELAIVCEGGPDLRNDYSILPINPAKHAHIRNDAAQKLTAFLLSPSTSALIERFGTEKYGEPVFTPAVPAGSARPAEGS